MNKISVVIPSYNSEATIERTLNSVLNQTYQNFEIIIVSDGSTDKSNEIIENFIAKDNQIKLFKKENGGVSSARNEGLKHITGDYVQFLDADDDFEPNAFEYMLNMIKKNDADMAVCRFNHPFFQTFINEDVYDCTKESELLRYYQDTYATTMPWNKLIKRELVEGAKFEEDLHFAEDEVFSLYLLRHAKKIVTTDKYLYHYFLAKKSEGAQENSAVNKIMNSKFWEVKSSFWYLGEFCTPFRKAFLEDCMKKGEIALTHIEDMLYMRVLDYLPWECVAFVGMGVPVEPLSIEVFNVTGEDSYKAAGHMSDKYGLSFIEFDDKERMIRSRKFVEYATKAYNDIVSNQKDIKVGYVFADLIVQLFYRETAKLNTVNFLALHKQELNTNSTPEAQYVNELMK